MKKTTQCEHCLENLPEEKIFTFDGQKLCEDCLELYTVICDDCGTRFPRRDDRNPARHLCPDCFESHYNICGRCSAVIHDNECSYLDD